MLFKGI